MVVPCQMTKFTIKAEQDGQLPFLDTLVIVNDDGTLKTKIYRKPTHTDQYLNWYFNHHLEHKRSLQGWKSCVWTSECGRGGETCEKSSDSEWIYIRSGLFRSPRRKLGKKTKKEGPTASKHPVCIPYISGLSEQLQRVFKSHGVSSYHKPFNTLRSLLVSPKDMSKKEEQCGVVYSVNCSECDQE